MMSEAPLDPLPDHTEPAARALCSDFRASEGRHDRRLPRARGSQTLYKASIGEDVHDDFLFMKPVVAGPGDYVCRRRLGGIYVNDARIAEDKTHDQSGRPLPQWTDCRRLADEEVFTLSSLYANKLRQQALRSNICVNGRWRISPRLEKSRLIEGIVFPASRS